MILDRIVFPAVTFYKLFKHEDGYLVGCSIVWSGATSQKTTIFITIFILVAMRTLNLIM
jgi:hypothetical protein